MKNQAPLIYKIASEESEFEKIHRLNYRTFVEDLPQHPRNREKRLVDKFHNENTYIICLSGDSLAGMVAIRDKRPFSLDEKLENLNSFLPKNNSLCEIRLLTVDRSYYGGRIVQGLFARLIQYFQSREYDIALISGTVNQKKLYKHLGFVPFGPLVGDGKALFQPMYITIDSVRNLRDKSIIYADIDVGPFGKTALINLLPGPVKIKPGVRRAHSEFPLSHRSEGFVDDFQWTKWLLCSLVRAGHVEILMGSGTLANDAIAAQLSTEKSRGLIMSNGEFGERLIDHANRFVLGFDVIRNSWGKTFDYDAIEQRLSDKPKINWMWCVHCETSTGMINDILTMKKICKQNNIRLCLDCISTIGVIPIDLQDVYLASCVSGKGLGAYPGLSMVFHNHMFLSKPQQLPRYLDLGLYSENSGVPFTISSNLVYALKRALEDLYINERYRNIVNLSNWLRKKIKAMGLDVLLASGISSPAIITIPLPGELRSVYIGKCLEDDGYLISYKSKYLAERNWIQLCLMGESPRSNMKVFLQRLGELLPACC